LLLVTAAAPGFAEMDYQVNFVVGLLLYVDFMLSKSMPQRKMVFYCLCTLRQP